MAHEELSTIFVAGFPADAHARELENLCRFMPGYLKSKLETRKGTTLFAMFDCGRNANFAINALNNQSLDSANPGEPMRAVMARSNMRTDGPGGPAAPGGPGQLTTYTAWGPKRVAPPVHAAPASAGGWGSGAKRPRTAENPAQVDTVAVTGAYEAGYDSATLEAFFAELPGFVVFKPNPRMGGGFAKFESPSLAVEAVTAAEMHQVPGAEIARSSMNAVDGHSAPHANPVEPGGYGYTPSYQGGGPPPRHHQPVGNGAGHGGAPPPGSRRPRIPENPAHVDTVAIVGAFEMGHDETTLQAFFAELGGFVAFKGNPRMGGGFAKFQSAHLASQAIAAAEAQGIPAATAKSSMSVVG